MDKYLVSLAFFLLCLECGWLAEDLNLVDVPWLKTHTPSLTRDSMGEIKFVKRNVRRRSNASLVWEETKDTQKVFAYDSVLTLDQSAAEVNLNGGTQITLHENTLVSLEPVSKEDLSGAVRLRFGRGSMRANLGRAPADIGAGEWLVEAQPQSQITVRSKGPGVYEIESHRGEAKITTLTGVQLAQVVKVGETVEIKDQKISEPKPVLEVDWAEPRDGLRLYTHEATAVMSFGWKVTGETKVSNIAVYNPDTNQYEKTKVSGENQNLKLKTGHYSVQLENDTVATFARNISVWSAPKIYLLDPLPRQRTKLGKPFSLSWTLNSEVSVYCWQVASDESFKNVIREGETDQNFSEVLNLPLGSYYWRVFGKDEQGFIIPEIYYNSFQIVSKPLQAPKLKSPHLMREDESWLFKIWKWILPQAQADDSPKHYKAEFLWEPVPGAAQYSIEMSTTPDFQNIVLTAQTVTPRYVWKNFKLGSYYWRVAALEADGEPGLFSEVAIADLKSIPIGPITPGGLQKPIPLPVAPANSKPTPSLTPAGRPVAATPTPQPNPEDIYVFHPYTFSVELGGHYIYEYFKGQDFNASVSGPYVGDGRLTMLSPFDRFKNWRGELEFQRVLLKTTNSTSFPFQDQSTNYGFDLTAIKESPFAGEHSWGFSVLNQYALFQRSAAEDLAINFPVLAGPVLDWRNLHDEYETHYRLAAYLGNAVALEARASYVILLPLSESVIATLTLEGRGVGGITSGAYWGSATGLCYFGVRW